MAETEPALAAGRFAANISGGDLSDTENFDREELGSGSDEPENLTLLVPIQRQRGPAPQLVPRQAGRLPSG